MWINRKTFLRSAGGYVAFSVEALQVFENHRQSSPDTPEAGGILLGRMVANTADVVIDQASAPGPLDLRGRHSFHRRRTPAQGIVTSAWTGSDGTQNYLGEWHSHPEDHPNYSADDLADWHRLLTETSFAQESLFFVIVGREEVSIWEMRREGLPEKLERPDTGKNVR